MYTVFIQSYNSPNKCSTLDLLVKYKFNNNYYIIIGEDDPKIEVYKNVYKNHLLIFDKEKYKNTTDTVTFPKQNCSAVYVKNFIEDYTQENNIENFVIIDDDLERFNIRYPNFEGKIKVYDIENIDIIFNLYFQYMNEANIDGLCFGSQYLYMGGMNSYYNLGKRMLTNIYIRTNKNKVNWKSLVFDDFNTSLDITSKHLIFLMIPFVSMIFAPQYFQLLNKGLIAGGEDLGLQTLYDNSNSFERAFYSTVICPSSAKPYRNKNVYMPNIKLNNVFPKIISDKFNNF